MGKRFLHHLLADSAGRAPGRPAIRFRSSQLTYGELDRLSNQLSRALRAKGVKPGDRVALLLEKSASTVAALFAILKAGAAYVPVDPQMPATRVAYTLEDCQSKVLITTARRLGALPSELVSRASFPDVLLVCFEGETGGGPDFSRESPEPLDEELTDENSLAYILYTSGSTGVPKGVMIGHKAALSFVEWAAREFILNQGDRLANHAPLHFDLSIFDIFGACRAGACVVLVPPELSVFPLELSRFIQDERITVWYSVPSALTRLVLYGQLEQRDLSHLREVLFAGEVFPVKFLRRLMQLLPGARFNNLYGPTETNVCTFYPVAQAPPEEMASVPIGRACAGCEILAVSEEGLPVEPGEEGELVVRGPSLMTGYWGQPERTREAMMTVCLPEGAALFYRTGDSARFDEQVGYVFLGRRDEMVKTRGYRVELGEIEAVLYSHPDVESAAAVALPHEQFGNLVAAFVALHSDRGACESDLRRHCCERLPKYMVPDFIQIRANLPGTPSGKIDKKSLAAGIRLGPQGTIEVLKESDR